LVKHREHKKKEEM